MTICGALLSSVSLRQGKQVVVGVVILLGPLLPPLEALEAIKGLPQQHIVHFLQVFTEELCTNLLNTVADPLVVGPGAHVSSHEPSISWLPSCPNQL